MSGAVLGVRHTPPNPPLPRGAWDCHTHVFGPANRFPFDPARSYTPGPASAPDLLAHQQALGLDRVVIVQPTPYGRDNACTLDAVAQLGCRACCVAVVDPALDRASLRALHERGVRGLRLNLETNRIDDPDQALAMLQRTVEQAVPLGWHVQTYTNLHVIAALHRHLAELPVPLVVDHFGRAMAAAGVSQPGFGALLDLVAAGVAYVKLSAAQRIAANPDDAEPIARAIIAANPARILWGSDWPHTGRRPGPPDACAIEPFEPFDDGAALARLRRWTDDATLRAILVDNPTQLYGEVASSVS